MVDVNGKWALITGAARGIGCNLILHARKAENCAKVLEEVKALGAEAYAVGAEFSNLVQVEKACRNRCAREEISPQAISTG
ncbi:MAG: hypothetical protein E7495_04790 [Ruminococcus flavefaciens]|jgi:short-subunit dehydrogenase|nr:hypothetical protein [Ruminococcus flavefaciens]